MFYVFFALPEFWSYLTLDSFWAAVVGLSVWTAAYQSEAVRSGIISVDAGQFEASEALAMTRFRYMRRIILPQSARIITPPFIGNTINAMKQTSLATAITVPEMTLLTNRIIAREFVVIEPLVTLAIIFLLLTTILVLAQMGLERVFRLKA
jgi:ABC-type amino acid transport system permease subunit